MTYKKTTAVIFEKPGLLEVREASLRAPAANECLIESDWSGISTGTERLMLTGEMPPFPGRLPTDSRLRNGRQSNRIAKGIGIKPGDLCLRPEVSGSTRKTCLAAVHGTLFAPKIDSYHSPKTRQ